MKKKSIFALLILSLLVNGLYTTKITAAGVPPSMITAYNDIMAQRPPWGVRFPIEAFDIDVWNEYDVLVVDIPGTFPTNLSSLKEPDGSANDYNSDVDEYRYIGYNPDGYLVNNPKYPDDHSGSAVINTYDWQENADSKTDINQYISSPEDQTFYETEIFYFLEKEYGHRFDNTEDPSSWLDNAIVIVPVSSTGDGVIKYMHKWDSNHDGVKEDWYITVNLRAKDEVTPEEVIPEEGTTTVTSTSIGTSGVATLGNTRIAAGLRGSEKFDVTKGIPTSEDLYANVIASEYIHSENYRNVTGTITYKVTVNKTYTLYKWDPQDKQVDTDEDGILDTWEGDWDTKTETVSKTYDVKRNYNFHMIDSISVYSLSSAIVNNAALPGRTLTLNSSVEAPTVSLARDTVVENHYQTPIVGTTHTVTLAGEDVGKSISNTSYGSVPSEDFAAAAEASIGKIRVKNDQLVFNGTTLMDGGWYEETAPIPVTIPDAPLCGTDDLYRENLTIPKEVSNGLKPSSGSINYSKVLSTETESIIKVNIEDLNSVLIHTPTVCVPTLNQISRKTQKYEADPTKYQLVLGETFHIDYPMTGEHLNIVGYGLRDYSKYLSHKQILFPFDVMVGTGYDGKFFKKNTWINFGPLEADFFIPEWNTEGAGSILLRSLPINLANIDDPNYEYQANLNPMNYKAVESFSYELSGKLESFQVNGGGDDYWAPYLEKVDLQVGGANIKTDLPILPDKVAFKDVKEDATGGILKAEYLDGMMLGYPIRFTLESNSRLYGEKDLLRVVPRFYYVPVESGIINMSKRQEVDLYLADYSTMTKMNKDFILDREDRSLIGSKSIPNASAVGVSENLRNASRQLFSGSFFLENNTYAVPKGTDVLSRKSFDVNKEPFLKQAILIIRNQCPRRIG